MMKKHLLSSLFFIAMASFAMARQNVEIIPQMLSCEDLTNPSVLETRQPRFSWINIAVNNRLKGKEQKAYQIQVATTKEKLLKGKADLWDSGKVLSSDSHLVTYKGRTRCILESACLGRARCLFTMEFVCQLWDRAECERLESKLDWCSLARRRSQ